jgi:hypothetical protein
MSKVCKTCPWWKQVRGRDINTGKEVDQWDCSISFMPMLMIETAAQARSGAAATENLRNETLMIAAYNTHATQAAAPAAGVALTRGPRMLEIESK